MLDKLPPELITHIALIYAPWITIIKDELKINYSGQNIRYFAVFYMRLRLVCKYLKDTLTWPPNFKQIPDWNTDQTIGTVQNIPEVLVEHTYFGNTLIETLPKLIYMNGTGICKFCLNKTHRANKCYICKARGCECFIEIPGSISICYDCIDMIICINIIELRDRMFWDGIKLTYSGTRNHILDIAVNMKTKNSGKKYDYSLNIYCGLRMHYNIIIHSPGGNCKCCDDMIQKPVIVEIREETYKIIS